MYSFPQARDVADLLVAVDPSAINELRDRGLLAYQLKDFASALRDLEAYLRLMTTTGAAAADADEHAKIWEHVKALRKRVASLN
jgi:regulator of sirC expression with transglutaminase-like and TPR domain